MKKICMAIIIILVIIVFIGIGTNYIDTGRVATGHEPKYCIKISNENKITYWGLGYKVIRYTKDSINEPYENNVGVKMGNWFMKYDLPNKQPINIEYNGKTIKIEDYKEISTLENILENSKYNKELCDGIVTHKITLNNEIYFLKEGCKAIQKGDKQAEITEQDLDTILNIIMN